MATHVALAQEALKLGLAVVCDKPFALDAASARETAELADRLGLTLTVYQNRRWDSDFLTLRRLVDQGRLGTLTRLESRFERFDPEPGPPAAGGGTLLDFGSHLVDQALVLSGPVERVYAETRHRDGAGGLDEDVFVALTHRSGVRSHLWGSWRQGAPGPRFRATGTSGTFLVDGMDGQEALLTAGASPASEGERWGSSPRTAGDTCCAERTPSPYRPPAAPGTCSTPPSRPRSAAPARCRSTRGARSKPPPSWTPPAPPPAAAGP